MSDKNKDKEELNQDAPTGGEDSIEAAGTSDAAPAQAQDVDDEANAAAPSTPAESAESGESSDSTDSTDSMTCPEMSLQSSKPKTGLK